MNFGVFGKPMKHFHELLDMSSKSKLKLKGVQNSKGNPCKLTTVSYKYILESSKVGFVILHHAENFYCET